MSYQPEKFDQAVWNVVSGIAPGHVMSYGEVARAAGFPQHARMVSKAMCRSPNPLPWHRVGKSDRTLAFKAGSDMYEKQKGLLQKEGVAMINGRVVSIEPDEPVDLDKLIWGPADPHE